VVRHTSKSTRYQDTEHAGASKQGNARLSAFGYFLWIPKRPDFGFCFESEPLRAVFVRTQELS